MKRILFICGLALYFLAPSHAYAITVCTDAAGNTMPCMQIIDGGGTNKVTVKPTATNSSQADTAIVERNPDVGSTTDAPCTLPASTTACSDIAVAKALANAANSPGTVGQANGDPCTTVTHVFSPISQTSATTATIVAGTSAKKTYICHLFLFSGLANNVGVVEGTGTNCSTVSAGMIGGTTATNGVNLAANSGFESGNGTNAIAATATAADNFCIVTSTAGPLTGVAVTVQQ